MDRPSLACTVALVVLLAAGCGGSGGVGGSTTLVGAGSTLVAPLVAKWSADYAQRSGVTVTYGAIGSGGGIAQITARSVDFGASDAPLTTDQKGSCDGCLQIPWALAGTAVSYHVKGLPTGLKLSGSVLAGIYLGTVTRWNDSAIARLNPGLKLPATSVAPVFRSDGSGDTYAFSDFLAKVSPEWKTKAGVSTQVSFPTGVGAKGNEGVAAAVGRTDGAIGYLAISYVFSNHLDYALVQNAAGKFPKPGVASIAAAAKTVTSIPADNMISITNPPASAPGAYPISTFTYALVPKSSPKAKALRPFLAYAIGPGQRFGAPLQFAPLPAQVLAADRKTIARIE
jgi:phosphate transport system substrate-binding protein